MYLPRLSQRCERQSCAFGCAASEVADARVQAFVTHCRSAKSEGRLMRYLHTMVRVSDLDAALDFYCAKLG